MTTPQHTAQSRSKMTTPMRFKDNPHVKDWCMKLPDKSDEPFPQIRSIRPSKQTTRTPDGPGNLSNTPASASRSRQPSSDESVKRSSVSSSRSLPATPDSRLSSPAQSRTASARRRSSTPQPTASRKTSVSSASSGSISTATSLLQEDYDPRAKQPNWYRKLRPVLAGEAHNEDGTFTMDRKTDEWKRLRRGVQAEIDKEVKRDGKRYGKNCMRVYEDLLDRWADICMLAEEIDGITSSSRRRSSVMSELIERYEEASDIAMEALDNTRARKTGDGRSPVGFTKNFLSLYWQTVFCHEQLFTMWAGLQAETTPKTSRTKPRPGRRRRRRERRGGRPSSTCTIPPQHE